MNCLLLMQVANTTCFLSNCKDLSFIFMVLNACGYITLHIIVAIFYKAIYFINNTIVCYKLQQISNDSEREDDSEADNTSRTDSRTDSHTDLQTGSDKDSSLPRDVPFMLPYEPVKMGALPKPGSPGLRRACSLGGADRPRSPKSPHIKQHRSVIVRAFLCVTAK